MKATIRDIAERAGVSTASVSLVLNNKSCRISDDTKRKIYDTAKELGYVRKKDRKRSESQYAGKLIAVLYPKVKNELVEECIIGIENYASVYNYHIVQLYCMDTTEKCIEQIKMSHFLGVDGMILIPPTDMNTGQNNVLLGEELKHMGIPFLLLDKAIHKVFCDFVTADNKQGANMAMDYLIQCGHKKIGLLAGKRGIYNTRKRVEGYKEGLAFNNLEYDEDLIYYGDYSIQVGYVGVEYLLDRDVTAVVSCNGEMSLGIYEYAKENNKVIGEDISVISFGNIREARWVNPTLTSVIQPGEQMGRKAAEVIINRIEHKDIGEIKTNYFTPALSMGESVKRIN